MAEQQTIKIITTEDGSHTLHLKELDETFHSIHGAIQESNHVFIAAGLNHWVSQNPHSHVLKILEFGFGTGLNALLTALRSSENLKITYCTLEKFPLAKEITEVLNYSKDEEEQKLFKNIHSAAWNDQVNLLPAFILEKLETDFRDFSTPKQFDIIYYDAFDPAKQPELWSKSNFEKCYKLLGKGGLLVTYSAKGQLKRDLKSIGFKVESLPGPPGKFEITRAVK